MRTFWRIFFFAFFSTAVIFSYYIFQHMNIEKLSYPNFLIPFTLTEDTLVDNMRIVFMASLIYTLIVYLIVRPKVNFLVSQTVGILFTQLLFLGINFIPNEYTYNIEYRWFVLAAISIGFLFSSMTYYSSHKNRLFFSALLAIITMIGVGCLFTYFSYNPNSNWPAFG